MKDLPIPDQTENRAKVGARKHPVDVQSVENSERAVNLLAHGIAGANYYFREDNPPYLHQAPGAIPELYVREGILKRLLAVNDALASQGLTLFVHDAYRPVEVQNYFHDLWVPKYLRELHPDWEDTRVAAEVGQYWAQGYQNKYMINPLSPPPHATGGVVDLTLRDVATGNLLNMGSAFDAVNPMSFADYFEIEGDLRDLTSEETLARTNRRILYHAMSGAGFVVNPNEWWHFGYGDQLSARNSGAPHAVYSVLWLDGEDV